MEEAIVSSLIDAAISKAASAARDELIHQWGVKEEVDMLKDKLSILRGFLRDAEERQLKDDSVKQWLRVLKDIAYEADDLLDEFEAEALRLKVEGGTEEHDMRMKQPVYCSWFSSCPNCMKQISFRHKLARRIESIRLRSDEIFKVGVDLSLKVLGGTNQLHTPAWRESSSLLGQKVIGMDKEREKIISSLLELDDETESSDDDFSVLAIVGIGGIGKTTLAKYVFHDYRVYQHFNLMMWVFVSYDFNVKRITQMLIRAADGEKAYPEDVSLDSLQKDLANKLKGKKFFLVLDDTWNNDMQKWEQLREPLHKANRGSKILITTRSYIVAHTMGAMKRIHLEGLWEDDYWSFFKTCAFGREDPSKHPRLEEIGREIAEKLKGSPLAAKTLGRILNSDLDESYWASINNSELWELEQRESEILPALRLSYQYLPAHLKQCFGYCSLFPKDWEYDQHKLVQMWMGQGFIQPQRGERMEDVGIRYFNDLLQLFFFHPSQNGYTMHDLIHDLAQYIYMDECYRVEVRFQNIPHRIHHLSFSIKNPANHYFQHISKLKNLRSLLFPSGIQLAFDCIPRGLFVELKFIRVLDLRSCQVVEVPNSICNLKHLRYLDLSSNIFRKLPDMFRSLYNLQTLRLEACRFLSQLPKGMSELTNIRHLKADPDLVSKINSIGNLTSLQELELFKVYNLNGFRIEELKDMTELGGHLSIQNLENVGSGDEAREANLSSKTRLNVLQFTWNADDEREASSADWKDAEVLEGLQPHQNIRELHIKHYGGAMSPNWMQDLLLSKLEAVSFLYCKRWEVLPPLEQLRFLKSLKIRGMDGVKMICPQSNSDDGKSRGFPSLEELDFQDMCEWKEWLIAEQREWFPRLQKLTVSNCPKLRNMPTLPNNLRKLDIHNVGVITLPEFWSRSSPSSLADLNIWKCPGLKSLRAGLLSYQLTALKGLTIKNCPVLETLPRGFEAFVTLQEVKMDNCPKLLASWKHGGLPSSLKNLEIGGCPGTVNALLFLRLQDLKSLIACSISKEYQNLKECSKDVLPYLTAVQQLTARYSEVKDDDGMSPDRILFQYKVHSVGHKGAVPSSHVKLKIRMQPVLHSDSSSLIPCLTRNLSTISLLDISGCRANITSLMRQVLPHLTAIKTLKISKCNELISLGSSCVLKELIVENCNQLKSLDLPSLHKLTITDCPQLSINSSLPQLYYLRLDFFLPQLLSELLEQDLISLQELWIVYCNDLSLLPEELQNLDTLKVLRILYCHQVQNLPKNGLPKKLQLLEIRGCPGLRKHCKEVEIEWPEGVHIPKILVDGEEIQLKEKKSNRTQNKPVGIKTMTDLLLY